MLKKYSGADYSLMYFSDHGLNFVRESKGFALKRDPLVKESYESPFFITSGDMTDTKIYNVTRSGNSLIKFFTTWFGVRTAQLPDNYDIFTATEDDPMIMGYDEILKPYQSLHHSLKAEDMAPEVHALPPE